MRESMARWRKRRIAILIATLTALLMIPACGPASAPSAEEQVVPIGGMVMLTGAVGGPASFAFNSMSDYFDYFNEQESIPGVDIEFAWIDTGTAEPQSISAYHRFVQMKTPIVLTIPDSNIFLPWLERDQIPMLVMSLVGDPIYPPGWIYTIYPTWAESFAVWCQWALDNWEEDRPPKVTLMGPDTTSGPAVFEVASDYVTDLGVELMPPEFVSGYAPLDTSTQLLRASDRGTDYIYVAPIFTVSAVILKDAERLGLLEEIQFAGLENTQSAKLIEQVGPAAEGYSAPRNAPWYDETDIPGMKLLQDLRRKYGRRFDFTGDDAHGFVMAAVACEAVKRAIEEVGYDNLDGAAVRRGLDSMKGFDVCGIKTIAYPPDDRRGSAATRVYRVQNGEVVPVSDWLTAPMIKPQR